MNKINLKLHETVVTFNTSFEHKILKKGIYVSTFVAI